MDSGKYHRVFDSNRRKIVDIEKSAGIDPRGGNSPIAQAVRCSTRSRSSRSKLLDRHVFVDLRRGMLQKRWNCSAHSNRVDKRRLMTSVSRRRLWIFWFRRSRQPAASGIWRCRNAFQLKHILVFIAKRLLEFCQHRFEDQMPGARCNLGSRLHVWKPWPS